MKAIIVRHTNGNYYVQTAADNRWGFSLLDDDQAYPGGIPGEWTKAQSLDDCPPELIDLRDDLNQ